MLVKVQKWGNSLAVRLPSTLTREAALIQNAQLDAFVEGDRIVLRPLQDDLSAMLAAVTAENLHDEVECSSPVGKECW